MEYHEVLPICRSEAERLLGSGNETAIIQALLSSAYHDADWPWVQNHCVQLLEHSEPDVRRIAVICFGHIARIHRTLDLALVLPKLWTLKEDASMSDCVEDTLEDIRIFVRSH
jgi:hypothetical protein